MEGERIIREAYGGLASHLYPILVETGKVDENLAYRILANDDHHTRVYVVHLAYRGDEGSYPLHKYERHSLGDVSRIRRFLEWVENNLEG